MLFNFFEHSVLNEQNEFENIENYDTKGGISDYFQAVAG